MHLPAQLPIVDVDTPSTAGNDTGTGLTGICIMGFKSSTVEKHLRMECVNNKMRRLKAMQSLNYNSTIGSQALLAQLLRASLGGNQPIASERSEVRELHTTPHMPSLSVGQVATAMQTSANDTLYKVAVGTDL